VASEPILPSVGKNSRHSPQGLPEARLLADVNAVARLQCDRIPACRRLDRAIGTEFADFLVRLLAPERYAFERRVA
jgi:hypothetical protein